MVLDLGEILILVHTKPSDQYKSLPKRNDLDAFVETETSEEELQHFDNNFNLETIQSCNDSVRLSLQFQRKRRRLGRRTTQQNTKRTFECYLCKRAFCGINNVRAHMQVHAGKRFHSCDQCTSKFTSVLSLRQHQRTLHEQTLYKNVSSDNRTSKSSNQSVLDQHKLRTKRLQSFNRNYVLRKQNQSIKYFDGDQSSIKVKHEPELDIDEHTHSTERYSCEKSPKKFVQTKLSTQKLVLYSCDQCAWKFTHGKDLHLHQRTHSNGKRYVCTKCSRSFKREDFFRKHEQTHSDDKRFAKFKPKIELNVRKRKHSAGKSNHSKPTKLLNNSNNKKFRGDDRPFSCDLCSSKFKNKSGLYNHRRIHTGEKKYSCDECASKFLFKTSLDQHKRVHTGEKPYSCDECSSTFSQLTMLNNHKRIHTGEKPYSCDECFSKFSQLTMLKQHKRLHTGEKPYSCDQCAARFTQLSLLNQHKRHHIGEKPYSCDQCSLKFSQLVGLKGHKRIAHKEGNQ